MKIGDLVQISDPFKPRCADPEVVGIIVQIDSVLKTDHGQRQKRVPFYRIMFKNDYVWLFRDNVQPFIENRTKNDLDNIAG